MTSEYAALNSRNSSFIATVRSKTLQKTEARFISNFGWGLTKQIENHSLARFKANIQRVRLFMSIRRIHILDIAA